MKVIIEGVIGKDFPNTAFFQRPEALKEIERAVRRRLELRAEDIVELRLETHGA